jgi:uncharacterized protein YaaN involved in tellurite resistance
MTADNYDEEHINDIDIYSVKTFITDPKYVAAEKSAFVNFNYNATKQKVNDVLHKYQRKDATINPKDGSAGQESPGSAPKFMSRFVIKKSDSNTEIFLKYKRIGVEFNNNVDTFTKHMSTLDQETLQAVELRESFHN